LREHAVSQVDAYPERTNNYLRQLDVYLHGKPNVVHIESATTLGGALALRINFGIKAMRAVKPRVVQGFY
jgi:hypothetical protein